MNFINEIREYISKSKLKSAIRLGLSDSSTFSSAQKRILRNLEQRHSSAEEEHLEGTITDKEYDAKRNKIVADYLKLLDQVNNDYSVYGSKEASRFSGILHSKKIRIAFLFVVFSFLAGYLIYSFEKEASSANKNLEKIECVRGLDSIEIRRYSPDTVFSYDDLSLDKVEIKIQEQIYRTIKTSILNKYGEIDIVTMWIELVAMRSCVHADIFLTEEYPLNDYYLTIVPEIKQYQLLAPTYTNSEDPITMKNEDTNTYFIRIGNNNYSTVDLKLRALIFDKFHNISYLVESDTFKVYGKKCLEENNEIFRLDDVEPNTPPYLYKLMTNGQFWSKMSGRENEINKKALCEISLLTGRTIDELKQDIEEGNIYNFQELKGFPSPYDLILYEITGRLINKLSE